MAPRLLRSLAVVVAAAAKIFQPLGRTTCPIRIFCLISRARTNEGGLKCSEVEGSYEANLFLPPDPRSSLARSLGGLGIPVAYLRICGAAKGHNALVRGTTKQHSSPELYYVCIYITVMNN